MALISSNAPSTYVELGKQSPLTLSPAPADAGEAPRLLGRGHAGEDVRALQQKLRDAGMTLKVDGIFGPETEAAVRAFQARPTREGTEPLVRDGLAGPKTMQALNEQLATRSVERGREFSEQSAPKVSTPASELPGTAMSARDVVQALQSNANPQQVLSNGLPSAAASGDGKSGEQDLTGLGVAAGVATGAAAAGAGAIALARRPANFKGVEGGDHVYTAAEKLKAEADRTGRAQKVDFNGKSGATLVAKPGDSVEKILEPYAKKQGVDVATLTKEGKAETFRAAHGGHAERAVDQAFRRGVNEHIAQQTGSKAIQLKPGQTLADLDGKLTGSVLKGAREAGDAAVEQLKATPPKASAPKAPQPPSVDTTYRRAVNEHIAKQTGSTAIRLKPGQTLADLDGKLTGNVLKGAREAGDAAVEAMPKPTAGGAVPATEAAAAKAAAKAPTSMLKIGGRALVVGAAAMDAVDLANAHQADKARGDGKSTEVKATAASIGFSWGGAIAGAKVGAATAAKFGLIAGPKGAAVAGVVGGLVGAIGGVFAGDAAGEAIRAADAGA